MFAGMHRLRYSILIAFTTTLVFSTDGTELRDVSLEQYDEEFSKFLEEILNNFKSQMPTGIPEINVPPVDPLAIPNIDENIDDGIAKLILRMRKLIITDLSQFSIEYIRADLDRGFLNASLNIPHLKASGFCYMDGKILGIFPINSNGDFFINVTRVRIQVHGNLNITRGEELRIHMNELMLSLEFGPLDIEFSSLMNGTKWAQTLIKLLKGLGRTLFMHFHREAMSELDKILLKVINKELDKGTLAELINNIPIFYSNRNTGYEVALHILRRYAIKSGLN